LSKAEQEWEMEIVVIGGGLAGCEAAHQLARRGHAVRLVEMKPGKRTPAQSADGLAELVCSNSLRSDHPENAVGLLHEELRRLSSLILEAADETRVPAGDALAVDRDRFSRHVTERVRAAPGLTVEEGEVTELPPPPGPAILATGPLTAEPLARALAAATGGTGLYFYDSIAPIVAADSLDLGIAFAQSRYGKGGGADYLNLPLDEAEYRAFVAALREAEKVKPHEFEEPRYFEGCLPIEVMAERGDDVLAYGPMKPVGLVDPRTGKQPFAVVQLRREDRAGTAYNLVGFQTRLTWPEQRRIFRTLPGLARAEFLRLGQIHRNTFLDSPRLLGPDLALRAAPHLFVAGQLSGVEGYVESCASGLLVALAVEARLAGRPFVPPPAETALGALYRHVTGEAHPPDAEHQPTNITWGLFPPLPGRVKKRDRRARQVERARRALATWAAENAVPCTPIPGETPLAGASA
jgi:methylenetetrahydrofolate--tRNA-(uracil-5-)-methyltransferase